MMHSEWLWYDNNWYYLQSWGGMYKSQWVTIKGATYYFRSWGGIYKNGWQEVDGEKRITSEAGEASIRIPTSTAITLIKTVSAGTAKISAWQSTQDTREEETARKSRSDRDHRPIRRRLLPEHAVWQPVSMSMS